MAFSTGVFQVFFDLIRTKLIRAGRPGKCDGKREMNETFERERNIWKKLVERGEWKVPLAFSASSSQRKSVHRQTSAYQKRFELFYHVASFSATISHDIFVLAKYSS